MISDWAYLLRADPDRCRQRIVAALCKSRGNVSVAATWLGISRRSMYRYLSAVGMPGQGMHVRAAAGIGDLIRWVIAAT